MTSFTAHIFRNIRGIAAVIIPLFLLCSCIYEKEVAGVVPESGDKVTLVLSIGNATSSPTKSYNDLSNGEGTIRNLRMIIFKKAGTSWVWEHQMFYEDFSSGENPIKIEVTPGQRRIYFFANENTARLRLRSASGTTYSDFTFPEGETTVDELERIVIENFSYIDPDTGSGPDFSPAGTIQDYIPMTGIKEFTIIDPGQSGTFTTYGFVEMERCISEADIHIGMKNGSNMTGKSLKINYVSINNAPSRQYLLKTSDNDGRIILPSLLDYNFTVKHISDTPKEVADIQIGSGGTEATLYNKFYITENPFGRCANIQEVGGSTSDHLEEDGYSGQPTTITLCYRYDDGVHRPFDKIITKDLPYIIRNGKLIINAIILPPDETETFEIDVKVETQWIDRIEDIPAYN
ncbi:MAG: fimbrial protein [Candidatus Cryptobacteroides sp.]